MKQKTLILIIIAVFCGCLAGCTVCLLYTSYSRGGAKISVSGKEWKVRLGNVS